MADEGGGACSGFVGLVAIEVVCLTCGVWCDRAIILYGRVLADFNPRSTLRANYGAQNMAKVSLDALIDREDFEIAESLNPGKKKDSISIEDLKNDSFFISSLTGR